MKKFACALAAGLMSALCAGASPPTDDHVVKIEIYFDLGDEVVATGELVPDISSGVGLTAFIHDEDLLQGGAITGTCQLDYALYLDSGGSGVLTYVDTGTEVRFAVDTGPAAPMKAAEHLGNSYYMHSHAKPAANLDVGRLPSLITASGARTMISRAHLLRT